MEVVAQIERINVTNVIKITLLFILFIIVFIPSYSPLLERFSERDSYYSHGYIIPFVCAYLIWRKKKVLKEVQAQIIVGNIGTYKAAEDVITKLEGVAGLRVGIGSGSICSTSVVTRAGAPTLFATSQVADAVTKYGSDIPIIADGGIRNPGDVAVAMAVGASCTMMGNVFAGCRVQEKCGL